MDLSDICGAKFLDPDVYWNTSNPDIPECFQMTVFPLVLFLYSVIFCFPYLLYIRRIDSHHRRPLWLCIVKLVLSCALLLINIVELIALVIRQHVYKEDTHPLYLLVPGVQGFLMAVMIMMAHFEHVKDVKNSGYYFCFWLIFTIITIIRFRSSVLLFFTELPVDYFRFVPIAIHLPLVVTQLVMSCITVPYDPGSDYSPADEKRCPENYSSFLSRILFWWFNRLVVLGHRRPLLESDLWSLNEFDKSFSLVPKFTRNLLHCMPCREALRCTFPTTDNTVDQIEMEKLNDTKSPEMKDGHGNSISEANGTSKPSDLTGPGENSEPKDSEKLLVTVKQPNPQLPATARHCVSLAILRTFYKSFLAGFVFKLANDILMFINPQLLKWLLKFVDDKDQPGWRGYIISSLMLCSAFLQTIVLQQYFHTMTTVGMRIRSSLTSTIYRKSLRLSNKARKVSTMGEIVNLMSVDCQKLQELMTYLNTLWSGPFQICVAIYFLYHELGPSIFAGVAVMILIVPLNAVFAVFQKKFQVEIMKRKDSRIKLMNEILNGIKVLKLYSWELIFGRKILDIREGEIRVMRNISIINAFSSFTWGLSPFLVALTTFCTYVTSSDENILTYEKTFVSLTLFNILRFPLVMLPMVISQIIQAHVSVQRCTRFLLNSEIDPENVSPSDSAGVTAAIENGTFTWDRESNEQPLKNLTVKFVEGEITAVVGPVGCGKSSLLSALLGEMEKLKGRVKVKGSMAYVAQVAWIRNATVKDNILFGKPYDDDLYDRVLTACALKADLKILPDGDQTEIGEKGINLSGGQKQRISLARACYAETDVYLLDDPLSAVDAHVGRHIFEKVLGHQGLLRRRTRILVTHSVTVLSQCDTIVTLSQDGRVQEMGTYQTLMQHAGPFANFIATHLTQSKGDDSSVVSEEEIGEKEAILDDLERAFSKDEESAMGMKRILRESRESLHKSRTSLNEIKEKKEIKKKKKGDNKNKLIEEEKSEEGTVKFSVFLLYMKAIGMPITFFILVFYFIFYGLQLGGNYWLADWSNDATRPNVTIDNETIPYSVYYRDRRLAIYGTFGVGQAITQLIQSLLWALALLGTARSLHSDMLLTIMHCPMSFFDTTPLGRIMNRFSKDVETVDSVLTHLCTMFIMCFFSVLTAVVALILPNQMVIIPLVPIFITYFIMQRFYVASARQLKRLESVSRSPIYSHFSESLQGVSTIRAYGHSNRFIEQSEKLVDGNIKTYYPMVASNRWLAVRLETIGNLMVFLAAIFAVVARNDGKNVAGLTGLAVTYALGVTQSLNWMVRMSSELEANIVSVERIKEYSELETEAAWIVDSSRPPPEWPEGSIKFQDYSCRYRKGLDLVLRDLSFEITPGQKIGVVGRTGAGKSSVVAALFRIIEPASGRIFVDDINLSEIGLHDLRSRLTTIPQDPVLFSGSLRLNLDPQETADDNEIWDALEDANLVTLVRDKDEGLNMDITEGGENFSVGQRQLVCLARALLRRTKILVLDEATSAVDLDTDLLIQKTIREKFENATIFTIAHRLHTIIDYDKILVLDNGEISEFDTPKNLLSNVNSMFYSMAKEANLVTSD